MNMTINTPDQASSRRQCSHLTSRSDQSLDHPPQLVSSRTCWDGWNPDSGWTEIASVWAQRGETVKAADEGCSLSAVKCCLSVNELWGTVFHLKATLWFQFCLLSLTSITSTFFFYYPHLFFFLRHRPANFHGGGTALDFHWMRRHIKEDSNRSSVAMAQQNKLMTGKYTNLVSQWGLPCDKHTKRKRPFSTQQKDRPSTTLRLCWNWEQMESLLIPPAYRTPPSRVLLIFPLQEWQFFSFSSLFQVQSLSLKNKPQNSVFFHPGLFQNIQFSRFCGFVLIWPRLMRHWQRKQPWRRVRLPF